MPHTNFTPLALCALCEKHPPIRNSHLLPNFLFKRLRGAQGHFHAASAPKKPIQAGPTASMLCFDCEQTFSKWEGLAKQCFFPNETQAKLPIKYGAWLQLFATSISWRALTYLKYSTRNPHVTLAEPAQRLLPSLSEEHHQAAEETRKQWAASLLAERAPTAQNDQHLLFLSGKNFPGEQHGIVGFTVCETDSLACVFSQLGPACVVAALRDPRPQLWKNTRIHSLGGKFHVAPQWLPAEFRTWLENYFATAAQIEA